MQLINKKNIKAIIAILLSITCFLMTLSSVFFWKTNSTVALGDETTTQEQYELLSDIDFQHTISLADWETRTYNIDLQANMTTDTKTYEPVDLVIVLDLALNLGGDYANDLDQVKSSLKNFVDSILEKTPDSNIGISYYHGSDPNDNSTYRLVPLMNTNHENRDINYYNSVIDSLYVNSGGSDPDGIVDAIEQLQNKESTNQSHVLLFTSHIQGIDDHEYSNASDYYLGSKPFTNALTKFHDLNCQLSIVGYKNNYYNYDSDYNKGKTWVVNHVTNDLGKFYEITSPDQLSITFADIEYRVYSADIVQTISPYFELTEATEQMLQDNGYRYTENDDGTTTISYTNQEIPLRSADHKWTQQIQVVAKENFIGGNNIPASVEAYVESGNKRCYAAPFTGTPTKDLPVNVAVTFPVGEVTQKVALGQKVPMSEPIRNNLFNQAAIESSYLFEDSNKGFTTVWLNEQQMVVPDIANETVQKDVTYYLQAALNVSEPSQESLNNTVAIENGVEVAKYATGIHDGIYHLIPYGMQLTKTVNLKDWEDRTYDIALSAGEIPDQDSTTDSAIRSENSYTIRDYIDSRFEIEDENAVREQGGTIKTDADGTVYIEWNDQSIALDNGAGWTRQFTIKAKETFIGGNNICTNGSRSGVYQNESASQTLAAFSMPAVNVKCSPVITDYENVIFAGETAGSLNDVVADLYDQTQYTIAQDGTVFTDGIPLGDFTVEWFTSPELSESSRITDANVLSQAIASEQTYYLKLTYQNVGSPSADSTANSTKDGTEHLATGTAIDRNASELDDTKPSYAVYTVKVVSGELDITKSIDHKFTTIAAIQANQTFVFKIQKYALDAVENGTLKKDSKPEAVFYQTLSFSDQDADLTKTAKITGLTKGYYTVTEETAWSSAYTLTGQNDNYSGNDHNSGNGNSGVQGSGNSNTDQAVLSRECELLLIGECESELSSDQDLTTSEKQRKTFYGLDLDDLDQDESELVDGVAAEVHFSNAKKSWSWITDVTAVTNRFTGIKTSLADVVTTGR